MRTFTLLCLTSLLAAPSLHAQNWTIVNPDWHYHYIIHDSSGNETPDYDAYTIRVDSQQQNLSFLHPIIEETDSGRYINRALFLGKRQAFRLDGSTCFYGSSNILFLPPPANAWLLDTAANISVNSVNLIAREIYGIMDSVRQLILSSGDTIEQSKAYGILRYPKGYGQNSYYHQIGINGAEKGFQFPTHKDFYNFSIGDSFEHTTWAYQVSGYYPYREGFTDSLGTIERYIILDSIHRTDGRIAYDLIRKTRQKHRRYEYREFFEYLGTDTDTIWEELLVAHVFPFETIGTWNDVMVPDLENVYPHEAVEMPFESVGGGEPPYILVGQLNYEHIEVCNQIKLARQMRLIYSRCALDEDSCDQVDFFGWLQSSEWKGRLTHSAGLGQYQSSASDDLIFKIDGEFKRSQTHKLSAFTLAGVSCGQFDEMFIAPTPPPPPPIVFPDSLFPYPNPAQDYFKLTPDPEGFSIELALFDMQGKQQMARELIGNLPHELSLADLLPGIYLVRLSVPERSSEIYWHRLLIVD